MKDSRKLIFLSLAVGVLTGLAAVALLEGIHAVQSLVAPLLQATGTIRWPYLLLPGVGMLLSLLIVRYLIKDNIGHGVTKVLQAVSSNESNIKPHNMFSSVVTSALTIGFGGSVGAEAPIVYTGAAIGSNIGKAAKLSYKNITVLVGCGAAGAIAGIFKAPLAGLLFTMEILLFNISLRNMMPLLVSTLSAAVVSYIFHGTEATFACTLEPFLMKNIPFYLLLGAFCGFVSLYFTRTTLYLEDKLAKFKSPWLKWLLCSLGLGILILLFPPLFGEGYDVVRDLLNSKTVHFEGSLNSILGGGWGLPVFFALIMLVKVLSMTLTNAGGGVGGTFGPTLFVGAMAGFVLVRSLNLMPGIMPWVLPEQNFVLVGMAAMMAGVMQAPMTSIFLIAEITGGYELLLPLIAASTMSFCITRIWEKYSIYTKRIAQSGELLTHDSDQAALTLLHTADLIRDKYPKLNPKDKLRDILEVVSDSTAAVFPVVDSKGVFQGLVDMDDLRKHLLNTKEYDKLRVYNLMRTPDYIISPDQPVAEVIEIFEKTQAWRLPVTSQDGKYLGFISKSRILMAYREELKAISAQD